MHEDALSGWIIRFESVDERFEKRWQHRVNNRGWSSLQQRAGVNLAEVIPAGSAIGEADYGCCGPETEAHFRGATKGNGQRDQRDWWNDWSAFHRSPPSNYRARRI